MGQAPDKVKVIINPKAGQGRAARTWSQVEKTLIARGLDYEVAVTDAPGHAIELAQAASASGWPTVAAIGGDGTINEVIQGLVHSDTALTIIPGGTGNDLARSLGIPSQAQKAANLIWSGSPRCIDVGVESNRSFASLASVGFAVDVIHHVNQTSSLLQGPLKILAGVWKTIRQLRTHPLVVTCDGVSQRVQSVGVFVLNTKYTGGGLMMAPNADPTDGWLDVVVIREVSRWDLLTTLPRAYKGTHITHPAVELFRCRTVSVVTDYPLPKMLDGDLVGTTPLKASVAERALTVMVPSKLAVSDLATITKSSDETGLQAV